VTLESAFLELDHAASRLEEHFGHLHWAVTSAELSDPPSVVHQWQDVCTDFSDLTRELAAAARLGRLAVNGRAGLQGAHTALARCQECYTRLWLRFCADGLASGRRRALDGLRRRGPLATWARGVADATDRCLEPLYEVGLALGQTWQELVERAWLGLIVQSPGLIAAAAVNMPDPAAPVSAPQSSSPGAGENEGAGA
jgi:hypothetical protein